MFSTTVYEPREPVTGHRDATPEGSNECSICGRPYWNEIHRLGERYVPDAIPDGTPNLFCVEASDDNGRTYAANGLRWASVDDAKSWASGLAMRWFGCTNIRVRGCDDAGEPVGDTVYQTL